MEVMMGIDVIECEAGCTEGVELRANFAFHLPARRSAAEDPDSCAERIVQEAPIWPNQIGNLPGRQNRTSIDQNEMKSDAEPGQPFGARDRIGSSGRGHHQAGSGQNAASMALFDRFVDRKSETEIICRDNEPFHRPIPVAADGTGIGSGMSSPLEPMAKRRCRQRILLPRKLAAQTAKHRHSRNGSSQGQAG